MANRKNYWLSRNNVAFFKTFHGTAKNCASRLSTTKLHRLRSQRLQVPPSLLHHPFYLFWLGYALCNTVPWKPPNSVTVIKTFDAITAQDPFPKTWYVIFLRNYYSSILSYQFYPFCFSFFLTFDFSSGNQSLDRFASH